MKPLMPNDYTTVEYDGYVTHITNGAIGLSIEHGTEQPELWIPRKLTGTIEYHDGGDTMFRKYGAIRSLQVADWYVRREGLV